MEGDFKRTKEDFFGLQGQSKPLEQPGMKQGQFYANKDQINPLKDQNQKIKTPFKCLPVPLKSSQAQRYYKGYVEKKRQADGEDILAVQPSVFSMS